MLLAPDDLGSGPRMSKAIRSKGALTLYICSLFLVRFLGPLRVAHGQHVRQHFLRHSQYCSSRSAPELFDQPVDLFGLSSLHGSNSHVDGVVNWWTIGSITPNFFSIFELHLQFLGLGLLERVSGFPCAHSFLWRISTSYSCSLYPPSFLAF
ncbi:hypothetical protein TNCV_3609491 [Trichonephila clavipes]|nr:hypothetical protein TNCV_3609491 [Trichonephila clavipes]